MRSRSSLVALATTLLLHLGLGVAIVLGLPDSQSDKARHEPVEIALLAPAAEPKTSPSAAASTALQTEKRNPQRDTRAASRPKTTPSNASKKPPVQAETSTEMKLPAPSTAAPAAPPSIPSPPQAFGPTVSGSRNPPQASEPARTSVTDAAYASTNRKPPYPRLSQSNEEEGTVILRVMVKADGTAGAVEIKRTSGYPRLDEAARSTVQTWRFTPATVDGKPVAEWYQLAIPFTLQNN